MSTNFRDELLGRINLRAGGNSKRGMKEVASDLMNNLSMKDTAIADLTGLSITTIKRIKSLEPAESGQPYRPMVETIERCIRGCGAEINLSPVKIKGKFMDLNKPRNEEAAA